MKTHPCFRILRHLPALLAFLWLAPAAHAVVWTASTTGSQNWSLSSNWNGTIPNASGAVADLSPTGTGSLSIYNDVSGGITLGTLKLSAANKQVKIDPLATGTITMDSGSSSAATIELASTSGISSTLFVYGSLVLNSNLEIIQNNTTSTAEGAIAVSATASGAGSITVINNHAFDLSQGTVTLNSWNSTPASLTIAKGVTSIIGSNNFNTSVAITLGTAGGGDVAYIGSTTKVGYVNNSIVVAANTGGQTVIGSIGTTVTSQQSYLGKITLNQDLTVISRTAASATSGVILSGAISGTGGLTINGTYSIGGVSTQTTGGVQLTGTNTFTGDTRVVSGQLLIGGSLALQNSTLVLQSGDTGTVAFGKAASSSTTAVTAATLGGISGSRDLALQDILGNAVALKVGNNNQDTTYTGALTGAGSLTKIGTGALILGGASTYTGLTTVSSGTLQIGNGTSGSITSGTVSVASGATLAFNQADGAAYSGTIGNNGTIKATSAYKNTLSGNIGGTGGFTQAGSGTTTLSGYNTYSGATNVTSGLLQLTGTSTSSAFTVGGSAGLKVNGSLVGTVTSAGVVSGTGSISGATVITGTLAPGNSVGTIQTGNLSLAGGGTLAVELGRNESNVAASDLASVNGTVTLTGANLQLQVYTDYTNPLVGDVYFLISNDSTDAIVGTFSSLDGVTTTLTEGSRFTWNSQEWEITYTANYDTQSVTGGNDLAIIAVPEPGTWAMILGGLGTLIAGQRLRRRND
jgi:autotransporter-associated beta strand protein